jgi:hypothetical protein
MNQQQTITVGARLTGMNPFTHQSDSRRIVNRAPPIPAEPTQAAPRKPEAAQLAEVHASRGTATVSSKSSATHMSSLSRDENSSQLVNFPYALTAFLALGGGVLGACWGMVVDSAGLAATSSLVALIGVSFYGCSLFDE